MNYKIDKNYYLIIEDKAGENSVDRLYDTIISHSFWSNIKIIRLYEHDDKCDLDEFLQKSIKRFLTIFFVPIPGLIYNLVLFTFWYS